MNRINDLISWISSLGAVWSVPVHICEIRLEESKDYVSLSANKHLPMFGIAERFINNSKHPIKTYVLVQFSL